MTNTKVRHLEILTIAKKTIKAAGGTKGIDALEQDERKEIYEQMITRVVKEAACGRLAARNNVAKALRQDRWGVMEDNQGGSRPGAGRPLTENEEKRRRVSTRLAPGYLEMAKAIAEVKGLQGWGRAVEMALDKLADDPDLRDKLAELGIIVKASFV